jgi:NADPH:quinone reductase-like Zn-dependent oxidoreductase
MQAAGIDAFGGEVHMLELAAPPSPAPDEVVIAVHAAGVGNWDEIVRLGHWDVGRRPPLALGVEAAGVVAAVGEDVTTLAQGDEVLTHPLPLRHQGAWAEWLVAPDWPARVRDASPGRRGVAGAVNAARGDAATVLRAVADSGRLATITGDPPPRERGVTVADVYVRADGARLAALAAALGEGLLSLHVAATLPLAEAATALKGAVAGRVAGATVLTLERRPRP